METPKYSPWKQQNTAHGKRYRATSGERNFIERIKAPALKSTSHFLPQSTVSHRPDSSSEANSIQALEKVDVGIKSDHLNTFLSS